MKQLKKSIIIIIALFFILILLTNQQVLAKSNTAVMQKREYSEDFKKWLELSDEEKSKVMQPRIYDVKNTSSVSKNPLYKAKMISASVDTTFNLKNIIPNNLVIRNQKQTNICWALATLSSLETNLALANKSTNPSKVYDFSERHLEYATSKHFIDQDNPKGYNRTVGEGGNWYYAQSYLTNGMGAIDENDMEFENSEELIALSLIQNKTVTSQVYDTIEFEDYRYANTEKREEIMTQIKQHIQNYGSVYASIHGDSSTSSLFPCYNNETSAKYCDNSITHSADHAVSIIGWIDDFPKEKFNSSAQPESDGAWIIRNSWGEKEEYKLQELKELLLKQLQDAGLGGTYTDVSKITDDMIRRLGFTIVGDTASMEIGDHGLMYVSYEDRNISTTLCGIVKAGDGIDYENIYQYDEYFPASGFKLLSNKLMLCNVFDRKNKNSKEYLTQVSLYAPETYTCTVYVNPNGDGKTQSELTQIQLKEGNTETINAGYHTLEFAQPLEITGDKFAVVIAIEGAGSTLDVSLEAPMDEIEEFNVVEVETDKCFAATGNDLSDCQWDDLGKLSQSNEGLPDGDSSIKAFTVSSLYDNTLQKIEITNPPNKTEYFEGEDFQKEGMEVTAYYNREEEPTVVLQDGEYSITNGENLQLGQTSVKITYNGKSTEQTITVKQNTVVNPNQLQSIIVTKEPNKKDYIVGDNFERTGMIVTGIYQNNDTKEIKDYTIKNGTNLKLNQTSVTIEYENKTTIQPISVRNKVTNSNIDNITTEVQKVQAYYFTNNSQNNYTLINVEIDGILRNMDNDRLEYYYYISSDPNEQNISDWTKITENQDDSNKLQFTIDSRKIANYNQIAGEKVVYLYIKEVAIKGGDQSIAVSKSMKLETDKEVETHVDIDKREDVQSGNNGTDKSDKGDDTVANGKIPQTGATSIALLSLIIITSLGIFFYKKYNKYKI